MERKSNTGNEKSAVRTKVIDSRYLTPECWSIQLWGLYHCRACEQLATRKCRGYRIRKEIFSGKYPTGGLPDLSDGF